MDYILVHSWISHESPVPQSCRSRTAVVSQSCRSRVTVVSQSYRSRAAVVPQSYWSDAAVVPQYRSRSCSNIFTWFTDSWRYSILCVQLDVASKTISRPFLILLNAVMLQKFSICVRFSERKLNIWIKCQTLGSSRVQNLNLTCEDDKINTFLKT